ncbi:hypothetical protein FOMPIDRAFT_1016489 [Fomitopsis schrenkii]|uniref:Uncharacterized protein n=1 Tax=Fomitopsis schrenkii TaxID=2126942 RepID=S8E5P6_FOMSC|nr:hypothetical protein FOMPIDRAFT_1016489 [Fomitopsis schrenkii]
MNHTELVIDNASVFFGTLGAVITAGAAAWKLHFAHHFRLKEANDLIGRISQTIHTLTDDDKVAIDATQTQRNKVDEALAASSFFNFPWSDLAQSIEVLLKQCRELHESVQHRRPVSTPTATISSFVQQSPTPSATISSFIQQTPTPSTTTSSFSQQYQTPSPTISTFIQQPPSLYTGSSPSGSPYSHTGFTGTSSLSGYSGHTVGGGPNYAYPPNPSSPTLPTDRGQPFIYNAGPSQPTYPPYPGQSMTPSATVSTTSLYPASTASQDQGSTRSLQTNQSAQYSSQYSASSGTSGYGKYLIFHCPFDVHDRRLRDLCKPSLIGIICLELDAVVGQCNRWASLM